MAQKRLPRSPKKPKTSASVAVKENYLKRYADYKKRRDAVIRENKRSLDLTKKIAGLKK